MMTYEKKLCVGVKGARVNINSKTIFTGDNLPIMRGMNSESVDLIYLDPPFNSNANYAAPIGSEAAGAEFKDTWTLRDVDIAWLDLIEAKPPALNRVIHAAMSHSSSNSHAADTTFQNFEIMTKSQRRLLRLDCVSCWNLPISPLRLRIFRLPRSAL